MLHKLRSLTLVLILLLSQAAVADNWIGAFLDAVISGGGKSSGGSKSSGSSGKSGDAGKYVSIYFGGGGGSAKVKEPETSFEPKTNLYGLLGLEVSLFGSPFFLDIGAEGYLGSGKLKYDYTGTDSVHYTDNDIKFTSTSASFTAGLKWRIINGKYVRFYIEGGGTWGSQNIHFDVTDSDLPTQGTKYISSLSTIGIRGHFADVGLEFGTSQTLRIAGRYHEISSDAILTMNNTKTSFTDLIGYIGLTAGL